MKLIEIFRCFNIKIEWRNIVRFLTLIPLSLYLIFCCYHFINESRPTYLDCGKVISRSNDEVRIKSGTQTELYLNIMVV